MLSMRVALAGFFAMDTAEGGRLAPMGGTVCAGGKVAAIGPGPSVTSDELMPTAAAGGAVGCSVDAAELVRIAARSRAISSPV